jgi:hypothetical protein
LIKKKADGRYAADLVLQLPAQVRFRCIAFHLPTSIVIPALAEAIARGIGETPTELGSIYSLV